MENGSGFDIWIYPDDSEIWLWFESGAGRQGTVALLKSRLQPNNAGASFKIFPINAVVTTVAQFNNETESFATAPVLDGTNFVALVKVVVKATDGTLQTYSIYED